MRTWIRKWLGVTELEGDVETQRRMIVDQTIKISKRIEELDRLTCRDADIGFRGNCTIVLTGVYRGKAYVQFYDVDPEEFRHMVEIFKGKKNFFRHIDAPHPLAGWFKI